MKGAIVLGVILGISGVALLWNGLNSRFSLQQQTNANPDQHLMQEAEAAIITEPPDTITISSIPAVSKAVSPTTESSAKETSDIPKDKPKKKTSTDIHFKEKYKNKLITKVKDEGWSKADVDLLVKYLSDPRAEFRPNVLKVNTSHKETEAQYVQYTMPQSLQRSLDFFVANNDRLEKAVTNKVVSLEVIIAILRVESDFGRYPGKEAIFNVYCSLSLGDEPDVLKTALDKSDPEYVIKKEKLRKRAKWGRKQLLDLIYMTHSGGRGNPLDIMGSWAGAFGLPQFIPTSYRAYGRDGNKDGIIDLDNIEDAAASISYYLQSNGWKRNPSRTKQHQVVMRYNISSHYADCVLALADSIKAGMHRLQQEM